jgi:SAM-dependent methyltransferase
MTDIPPTRWDLYASRVAAYGSRFEELIRRGEDIDGEARLADVLAPRGARILDAGAGMGRVTAALDVRGHHVTGVEKDPKLVAQFRRLFPELAVIEADILELSPAMLEQHGRPTSYDVVVVVGNVMIYLAEDTETRALRTLGDLLEPDGRILVGFSTTKGPEHSRDYPREEFHAHVEAAGLVVQHEFGTYELAPAGGDYVVAVLRRA